jgi:uncharacterized protein (DUF2236 family)
MRLPIVDSLRSSIATPLRRSLGAAPPDDAQAAMPAWADDADPGWFGPGSVVWRVHADVPAMLIGGISSLLLQTLHPGAMAGVDQHSNWRIDPGGRLQRTARFLAATTYGTAAEAEAAVAMVSSIHTRVQGVRPDGVPYRADDPELLRWVHVAEVFQFMRAYQRYGFPPLSRAERDDYLGSVARIGEALGATDVPHSVAEVEAYFDAVRPDLVATPEALATVHDLLESRSRDPFQRAAYDVITRAAVGMLPGWAREMLGLQRRLLLEDQVSQVAATAVSVTLRWVLGTSDVARRATARADAATTDAA